MDPVSVIEGRSVSSSGDVLSRGLSVRALRNAHAGPFAFDVPPGTCLVITGTSGAGKSVLLRMVADLDPHQGDVALDGCFCSAMPAHRWRRQVVYLPAEPGWWSDSVLDHMPDDALTRDLMAQAGLRAGVLNDPVHRLSTGERQRLALIRALRLAPRVLLMDEPCSALDEGTTLMVEAMMRAAMAGGTAIVLVSHDPTQAMRMADLRRELVHGHFVGAAS
ncbi:ABC transporter ATP-binding protein [Gluconacetobacter liquefaciens]|uniref:ABC-type iron transport system FetAB ATPase subunit n=1 Tax=Gluconacetobacter liquefaciens TaxID=89584 RepID=A0A370GBH9_GLULI|nr:ATP-binding cassette domain-containing protein [Gluconacetobacter liquefaciens]MBB2185550.1 ATP-binding cassette domain-containing protein [Gluconacetobacter liquefaciens]RDI39353.1 ABC-type iron transport system FetAB ATPase subunit [Gluconacetobacter liquefaciens]GBQ99593.1 ferrichrome ABC transporter ATP-binding protein [Gluconacetobacter liquefaciens NRIC 0522]GEB35994.1 ABC transporter ATP-binding protein [Gluconacetobacter liquefaciens]